MRGITEITKQQQQLEKFTIEQYGRTADLGTKLCATVIDASDQVKAEIKKGISEAKISSAALIEDVGCRIEELKQGLHRNFDRQEGVSNMTSEQLTIMQTLVSMISEIQLGKRTHHQDTRNDITSKAYPTANDTSDESEMINNPQCEVILARISHTANKVATNKRSRDAHSIIEDIGRLLGLVMQQSSATNLDRDDLPRKRKVLSDYHYNKLETEVQSREFLSRAKRVLTADQRVQISSPGQPTYSRYLVRADDN